MHFLKLFSYFKLVKIDHLVNQEAKRKRIVQFKAEIMITLRIVDSFHHVIRLSHRMVKPRQVFSNVMCPIAKLQSDVNFN